MNEITEYRQKTAEMLGLNFSQPTDSNTIWISQVFDNRIEDSIWLPDQNADQREMIEDWLIKQDHMVGMASVRSDKSWLIWIDHIEGRNKSKSIAFMKAFMEYIKSTEK